MLKHSKELAKHLGQKNYTERMRRYLNESFPESRKFLPERMDEIIIKLTERANRYKLILETDIAPFVVGAWLMGGDFDEKFLTVKQVLEDFNLASFEKSEFLWEFIEESFRILEE